MLMSCLSIYSLLYLCAEIVVGTLHQQPFTQPALGCPTSNMCQFLSACVCTIPYPDTQGYRNQNMPMNQTGRQTNQVGQNQQQQYYNNPNQQNQQQNQQQTQQQQQAQQQQQMGRNQNQVRPMNPNQPMPPQQQQQQGQGQRMGGPGLPGQQMTPQTMPPFPSHLMGASKKPRYFMALFDYDPATMSPNPDSCEEELPFNEGDTIRVSRSSENLF